MIAPEPNNAATLSLEFAFGLIGGGIVLWLAFGWRAVGIYQRVLKLCARGPAVLAPVMVLALVMQAGQWPKAIALTGGLACAASLIALRVRRRPRRVKRLRRWAQPLDYLFGAGFYMIMAYGLAAAGAEESAPDLGTKAGIAIGLFLAGQLTVNLMFRVLNRALEVDYGASFNAHYALATAPVAASVALYVMVGASPGGPLFRVALLAATWRLTDRRPTSVLRTFKALREARRLRTAPAT
jgi:hypothetical protein